MADLLPPEVRRRLDKSNLGANFKLGLLKRERETLETTILDAPPFLFKYVDVPALQEMYRRYAAQPIEHERESMAVFVVVTLATWLQRLGFDSPTCRLAAV